MQWIWIGLPMQGDTGSIPVPGRFHIAMEQLSPCATTTEPVLQSPWATITEAHMPRICALQREATTMRSPKSSPHSPTTRESSHRATVLPIYIYIYIYPWKRVEGIPWLGEIYIHTHTYPWKWVEGIPWLGLCASTARGTGLIPGWGRKILHAVPCGKK